jgi:FkbM family methyltransferase
VEDRRGEVGVAKIIETAPDTTSVFGDLRAGAAPRLAWKIATARSLAPATRRRLRKIVARRYSGPYDLAVENIRLRAYPAENYCDRTVLGRGRLPEASERALITPVLFPEMVFVDIGANVGVYSLYISSRTQGRARVMAFEPHPRSFVKLEFNCAINGFMNISCINAAVGPQEGEALLFADGGGNSGGASLRRDAVKPVVASKVAVVPLAKALENRGVERIDLLKIDVEGFEDEALLPIFGSAPQNLWPQHILLETACSRMWKSDVCGFLGQIGYRMRGGTPQNRFFTRSRA